MSRTLGVIKKKKKKKKKRGNKARDASRALWRWKKRRKKKKNQGPRYVSGPGGGDAGVEGGRRSRGRVLTRLELLLLVEEGGREGEGLETRFDASRASVARRRRVEGRERAGAKVVALARHTL